MNGLRFGYGVYIDTETLEFGGKFLFGGRVGLDASVGVNIEHESSGSKAVSDTFIETEVNVDTSFFAK